jgi:DNA-binding GntR family transcriptional regulator
VREAVLALLVAGKIPAGKRIDQRQLAKQLHTTTVPLREAFRALETEGLLIREPGVGVFCRVYTVTEIEDMVEIRGVLEALAARRACGLISVAEVAELRALATILGSPIEPGGEEAFVRTHVEFHRRIVANANSPRLQELLEQHHLIDGMLANIAPALWASEPHDHLGLVEAIASGDPDRAERTTREHIAPTYQKRFTDLRRRFGEGPMLPFPAYRR